MINQAGITKSNILEYKLDNLRNTELYLDNSSVFNALSRVNYTFSKFFTELYSPSFIPVLLVKGDIVSEKVYNNNLRNIYTDITSFYKELENLTDAHIASYNYATIITSNILNNADELASTVLDLNILHEFNRSDIIVAGDDFKNLDYVDTSAGVSTVQAELLLDGGGIGLAKTDLQDIVDDSTKVKITPLAPVKETTAQVNISPTPGNFERFYEGNYYNYLGNARPEGGQFNLRYISNPNEKGYDPTVPPGDLKISSSTDNKKRIEGSDNIDGFFLDFGATEEVKELNRLKMFDKDPTSFWECEYLFKLPSSLFNLNNMSINQEEFDSNSELSEDSTLVNIDLDQANELAKKYDYSGRDLLIELVITFPQDKTVNFVAINPIIFGQSAFPSIIDISTAESTGDQFITVEGWNNSKFSKTITPEANEFLTDSQLGLTLAPARSTYRGQGIYPFPSRQARKVRLIISMPEPVAQPYDKTMIMLKKTVHVQGTIKTTTKKGLLA